MLLVPALVIVLAATSVAQAEVTDEQVTAALDRGRHQRIRSRLRNHSDAR